MSNKIVKYTLDRNAQPTPEQIEELQRLAAMPGSDRPQRHTGTHPGAVGPNEAGGPLSAYQAASHGTVGCRRAGLAERGGRRVSNPHECHSAPRHVGGTQRLTDYVPVEALPRSPIQGPENQGPWACRSDYD